MTQPFSDIERLIAVEEIKKLFARRVRSMDLKDWAGYAAVHTEDAYVESYSDLPADKQPVADGASNRVVGPQAIAAMIEYFMQHNVPMTSVHHAHQPEIELTSATTATGIWPMEDHLWWSDASHDEFLHGYGHYYEDYRRVDGVWYIAHRKLTRLRVDVTPGFYDRLDA